MQGRAEPAPQGARQSRPQPCREGGGGRTVGPQEAGVEGRPVYLPRRRLGEGDQGAPAEGEDHQLAVVVQAQEVSGGEDGHGELRQVGVADRAQVEHGGVVATGEEEGQQSAAVAPRLGVGRGVPRRWRVVRGVAPVEGVVQVGDGIAHLHRGGELLLRPGDPALQAHQGLGLAGCLPLEGLQGQGVGRERVALGPVGDGPQEVAHTGQVVRRQGPGVCAVGLEA